MRFASAREAGREHLFALCEGNLGTSARRGGPCERVAVEDQQQAIRARIGLRGRSERPQLARPRLGRGDVRADLDQFLAGNRAAPDDTAEEDGIRVAL